MVEEAFFWFLKFSPVIIYYVSIQNWQNLKVLYAFQVHQLLQFIVKLAEHPNGKVRGSLPYMILGSCFSFILAHILISLNPGIALEDGSSKDS